ncbi:thiamine phosphate synthase [Leifsonia sp. L25]|uniref:thiamine phosphate synthase n=2 Tax=Actinomycetes TaxID=1760 RepID=UPI003D6812ED
MTGRMPLDLSLYLVTDSRLCGSRGVPATVDEAIEGGVSVVQLRDPDATDVEFLALGRAVVAAVRGRVPVLVDDRVHLVAAVGADGAHVGQSDLAPVEARRLLGPDAYLGLSVQTLGHVDRARALPSGVIDYLGVGPVWPQETKPDAADPCGVDGLAAIVQASPWPCVAIGGIGIERTPDVRAAGAAGIAVVSAICGRPEVAAAARALRSAWDGADS